MMRCMQLLAIVFVISITASACLDGLAAQTVRRVPGQYATIQAAIIAAQPLDRIEVGPGRYRESLDFAGKEIQLVSTHGPRRTVIDGGRVAAVVYMVNGEGPRTRLEGFTIANGLISGVFCRDSSPQIVGNIITRNRISTSGGGVRLDGGGAIVRDNEIFDNFAEQLGGGVYVSSRSGPVAPIIEGNRIHRNIAGSGGGIAVAQGRVFNNWIYENRAVRGGGVRLSGVGSIVGNTIVRNYGTVSAGGVLATLATQALIANCIAADNVAPTDVELPVSIVNGVVVSHNATPLGLTYGQNNLALTPGFVDAASEDYHLRVDSPLRDRGDSSVAPMRDVDGGARVVGAAVDIGADEIDDVLYVLPGTLAGRPPSLRVIGRPGESVYWTTSAGVLTTPVAIPPFGSWHLRFPIAPLRRVESLPPGGFARVDLSLTPAQQAEPLAFQALFVGPGGGRLSNAHVLRDTEPFPVRRVPAQYATIQAAIDAAGDDERIEVAPGTYDETIRVDRKAVYVLATGGPAVTTIDANWRDAVVTFQRTGTQTATLDGFTLTKGWGGVEILVSRPTIVRNRIVNNGNTGVQCSGGTNPVIRDNYIANNNSNFGGGVLARGKALVVGNEITGNTSSYGGGIHVLETPMILRNRIHRNQSRVLGGGGYVLDSAALLQNLWYRNSAQQQAGAIFFAEANVALVGNTITGNTASTLTPGVVFDRCRSGGAYENIIWPDTVRTITVPVGLGGNVTADPQFVDAAIDDYHLTVGSAAIDAGRASLDMVATDLEGDARPVGGRVDAGADERAPRLYHVGSTRPGQTLVLRAIGPPGARVFVAFSAAAATVPVKLGGAGFLRLATPLGLLARGRVASNGVYTVSIPIPAAFPPQSFPLQALIGSTLSNLDVVEIH